MSKRILGATSSASAMSTSRSRYKIPALPVFDVDERSEREERDPDRKANVSCVSALGQPKSATLFPITALHAAISATRSGLFWLAASARHQ